MTQDAPETIAQAAPRQSDALGWGWEIATLLTLVAAVALGQSLFFRAPLPLTLGPIAGLMAALGCRRWWSTAAVAAVAVPLGALAAPSIGGLSRAASAVWLPLALEAGVVAAVVGAVASALMRTRPGLSRLISALAIAVIVATMWAAAMETAHMPMADGPAPIVRLASTPAFAPQMPDEDLYQIWISRLRAGESYYPMAVRTFVQVRATTGPTSLVRIDSPFSYRPPTLYVLLAALPPNGISFVIAMMMVCSVALVAAYVLARQFANHVAALLSVVLVATLFTAYGTSRLLNAETWAGALVLMAAAVFAAERSLATRSRKLQALAVALAVLATAFREIAAPVLVLGLLGSLIREDDRERRRWFLWVGGLGVAALGLAAHWFAAARAFAATPAPHVSSTWFDPNGSGLVGALVLARATMALVLPVVVVMLVLAMAGSIVASRDGATRLLLGGIVVGGPLLLIVVHPPGWGANNVAPGYWGDILWPTILACVPLGVSGLSRLWNQPRTE